MSPFFYLYFLFILFKILLTSVTNDLSSTISIFNAEYSSDFFGNVSSGCDVSFFICQRTSKCFYQFSFGYSDNCPVINRLFVMALCFNTAFYDYSIGEFDFNVSTKIRFFSSLLVIFLGFK